MKYSALIRIDDDRWAKHPYSIVIYDEEGNQVARKGSLNSREACYRFADQYNIPHSEIKEEFY